MENIKEMVIFNHEEAEDFFNKNSFKFEENLDIKNLLGCIDDRDTTKRIAVPGSALGFYMAVYGAVDKLNINVDKKELSDIIHSIVGGLIHTDRKNIENNSVSPVAGCGHCSGILKRGGLSNDFSDFLNNVYLKELESEDVNPVIYEGKHNAKGVFVINDLETGIVSNDNREQAFVYNKAFADKILKDISEKVFIFIQQNKTDLNKSEFEETVNKFFEEQLKETLDHLTQGLPFFQK